MKHRIEVHGHRGAGRLGLLLVLLLTGLAVRPAGAQQQARRGGLACAECHANADASKERALGHAKGKNVTCLTCHHVGFSPEREAIAAQRVQVCKSCHEQQPPSHAQVARGAPACTGCHSIHGPGTLAVAAKADGGARATVSRRCAACHTTPHKLHAGVSKNAPLCTDCHSAHAQTPIKQAAAVTSQKCAACHQDAHPSHAGKAQAQLASACTSCHGVNGMKAAAAPQLNAACASCHKTVQATPSAVVLARAQKKGERLPGCADCHSFAGDKRLAQARPAIAERCGSCHADALKQYRRGAHAKGVGLRPNADLPSCVSCHGGHTVHGGSAAEVRMAATEQCVKCHSDARLARKYGFASTVGASYTRDYHGATMAFRAKHPEVAADAAVLACSDCHSAHTVSRNVNVALEKVCVRCHKEGDRKLAGAWLGHRPASASNRPLILLVKLFYWFLIPFELIGLTLVIVFHILDQRRKGAHPLRTHAVQRLRARMAGKKLAPVPMVKRFSVTERVEHLLGMTTFIGLVLTGLPQTRPNWGFCRGIIDLFGGISGARLIHRTMGVMFVLLLMTHVVRAVLRTVQTRQLPVMIPTRKDFLDALQTIKHYVRGAPRPRNGKFDASEKFEYWGLFLGGTLMSVTGFALIFPELFSRLVPGVLLATFRLMHGLEATFAVSVVALWHSYGVVLRPEVFPLDTSIFTGKISVERLEEEHTEEYERLFPEGEHEQGAGQAPEEGQELVPAGKSSEQEVAD